MLEVNTLLDLIFANAVQNVIVLGLEIFRNVEILAIGLDGSSLEDVGVYLPLIVNEHAF